MNPPAQPLWFVILSLSLTGAVFAAVTSFANDYFRRRFELRKWRAEFYIRPKLEALRNLHSAMVRSHYEINMRAEARKPQTKQEYWEQVERYEKDFFGAMTIAEIYMDSDTSEALRVVLGSVRQMSSSIWLRIPEVFESQGKYQDVTFREPDWRLFSGSFDVAEARLRQLLHPSEILEVFAA